MIIAYKLAALTRSVALTCWGHTERSRISGRVKDLARIVPIAQLIRLVRQFGDYFVYLRALCGSRFLHAEGAIDSRPPPFYHFLAASMHHATNSNPWILFFFIALALAIIIWAILSARKRTQELTQLAPTLGFTFMGKAWHGPALDPLHKTSLLQRTRGGFSNVMAGAAANLQTIVFDYTYRAGKSTTTQTLACFQHDKALPPFILKPENLFDRLGDAFVHNDIDFASNPVFSERYTLKSPDEQATRCLFTPSLLTQMEQLPSAIGWIIEANGTNLFVYRHGHRVAASDLATFLQETSTIARTIFTSDGLKNPAF